MAEGARELLAAAGAALGSGRFADAVCAAHAALEVEDLPEAHDLLAGMAMASDDLDEARRENELAFRGYRDRGDVHTAARAAMRLADLHDSSLGNRAAAQGWLERARRLLQVCGPCVEWGYLELAFLACNRDDIVELEASADRALAIAIEFGDRSLEVRALADGGLALVTAGRVRDGFRRLDEAMAALTAGEVADTRMAGLSFCSMLSSCDRAGDVGRAEEWTRIVREFVLDPLGGKPVVLHTHCLLAYGSVLCAAGRWQEAEAVLLEAIGPTGSRSLGHRADASACLALLRIEQGRLEDAEELLAPYADRVNAAEPLARLHLARGEADVAAADARRGLKRLRGDMVRTPSLLAVLVRAELARGDADAARHAAVELGGLAESVDSPVLRAEASLAAGLIAAAGDDHAAASGAFEAALEHLADTERPALCGETRLALAASLAAGGEGASAIVEARAALAAFERVGAGAAADRATALLRSLGAPARTRAQEAAPVVANLSSREVEVLDLLRHGLTNAEIAARLYISPKTAEHHVGRVLAKLGVRSRTEAATLATTLAATPDRQ